MRSRALREAGRPRPGHHCRGLRAATTDLSGTEPAREPGRAPPAKARRPSRHLGRRFPGALSGAGHRPPGGVEGRRSVRPSRPRLSAGTAVVHGGGFGNPDAPHGAEVQAPLLLCRREDDCLDSDWSTVARESTDNLAAGAVPSNLAYVMYTSGSTGQPKGADDRPPRSRQLPLLGHPGLRGRGGGTVPVHTSVSFDLTVTSLYPALLARGRAELVPEDVGAQELLAVLRRGNGCDLVKITPAHLDLLSRQTGPEEAAGMTNCSRHRWREPGRREPAAVAALAPDTRLFNEYGPTETVVGCCVYEVKAGDPSNGSVPNWPTHCEHPGLRPRPEPAARAPRRHGRTVHRRRGCRARGTSTGRS